MFAGANTPGRPFAIGCAESTTNRLLVVFCAHPGPGGHCTGSDPNQSRVWVCPMTGATCMDGLFLTGSPLLTSGL